jgi:hypothetical protein
MLVRSLRAWPRPGCLLKKVSSAAAAAAVVPGRESSRNRALSFASSTLVRANPKSLPSRSFRAASRAVVARLRRASVRLVLAPRSARASLLRPVRARDWRRWRAAPSPRGTLLANRCLLTNDANTTRHHFCARAPKSRSMRMGAVASGSRRKKVVTAELSASDAALASPFLVAVSCARL